jgi:hypothetical protein
MVEVVELLVHVHIKKIKKIKLNYKLAGLLKFPFYCLRFLFTLPRLTK